MAREIMKSTKEKTRNSHTLKTAGFDKNPSIYSFLKLFYHFRDSRSQAYTFYRFAFNKIESYKKLRLFLFTLLLACHYTVEAQQKPEMLNIYGMQEGLPSNMINAITQDRFGYIWIGTAMGISRFDGANFVTLSSKDSPVFFEDNKVDFFFEKDGFIYLGSLRSGVIQLNPENFEIRKLYDKGVSTIDYYNNNLLILFSDNTLLLIDENYRQHKRTFDKKETGKALLHEDGIYLAFYGGRPMRLNRKTLATEYTFTTNALGLGGGFFRLDTERILFHTGKKLIQFKKDSLLLYRDINAENNRITYFNNKNTRFPNYILNYTTPYFFQGDSLISVRFKEMKNTEFRLIFQPDQNSAMIGTNQGLLHLRTMPGMVSQIDDNNLFRHPDTRVRRKILETEDTNLVLTGYPNTLVKNKLLKNLYIYDAIKLKSCYYMGTDGDGLWEVDSSLSQWKQILSGSLEKGDRIYSILPTGENRLLIGGKDRLVLFNPYTRIAKKAKLPENTIIYKMVTHPSKKYYVTGTNNGLLFIHIKNDHPYVYPYIVDKFRDAKDLLFIPEKKELWAATDNGLWVMDMNTYIVKKKFIEPEEISNPRVTALIRDNHNRIWATTYSGITVYGERIFMLGEKNGLINAEFNYNSAIKRKNGDLIFGGLTGYDVIKPELLGNFSFRENFEISGFDKITQKKGKQFHYSVVTDSSVYSFYPDGEDLKLYFSNFDYSYADLYHYFYKIDEGSWNEIKQDRFLVLSNLPSGKQKVTIKMISPFGSKVAEKTITVKADVIFYKHPYFLILILSLLLSFVLISYYFLRKTLKIEAKTKERIAMDLHDETGTILTRLLFLSSRKNISPKDQDNIKGGLQEALLSLRSFMESLYRKEISTPDLKDEISEFIQKSFSGSPIIPEIHFNLGSLQKVNPELFRDLKLCIYELITNFIKHSGGKHFKLEIEADKKQLVVRSWDDGVLSDKSELNSRGNGIRNMQNRVLRHDGIIIFDINLPSGLKTELRFTL